MLIKTEIFNRNNKYINDWKLLNIFDIKKLHFNENKNMQITLHRYNSSEKYI